MESKDEKRYYISDKELKDEALSIAVNCVRNTIIEKHHTGAFPQSKTGDYSDVKVVTPFGEIPSHFYSRIIDNAIIQIINQFVQALHQDVF